MSLKVFYADEFVRGPAEYCRIQTTHESRGFEWSTVRRDFDRHRVSFDHQSCVTLIAGFTLKSVSSSTRVCILVNNPLMWDENNGEGLKLWEKAFKELCFFVRYEKRSLLNILYSWNVYTIRIYGCTKVFVYMKRMKFRMHMYSKFSSLFWFWSKCDFWHLYWMQYFNRVSFVLILEIR